MKKLLITGGTGFIDTNLTYYMYNVGKFEEIRIMNPDREAVEELETVSYIHESVFNQPAIEEALDGVNYLVHLPTRTSEVSLAEKANKKGFHNVLDAAVQANTVNHSLEKVVFLSSNAVFGDQEPPYSEEVDPEPKSEFGEQMKFAEYLVDLNDRLHSWTDNFILRQPDVFGPFSFHRDDLVSNFLRNIANEEPAVIHGDGEQTRDFLYVDDLCRAIYMTLTGDPSHSVYQVGTGKPTSINELAKRIKWMLKDDSFTADIKGWEPVEFKYDPGKQDDSRNYSNINRIRSDLGWRPRVDMIEGLMRTWGYFYDEVVAE